MLTRTVTQVFNPNTGRWAVAYVNNAEQPVRPQRSTEPSPALKAAIRIRESRRSTPARTVAAVTLDERQQKMVGKPITDAQMRAINSYERKLGNRLSTRAIIGDMADASVLRASLKAECEREGLI